jgi:hypothetical protein
MNKYRGYAETHNPGIVFGMILKETAGNCLNFVHSWFMSNNNTLLYWRVKGFESNSHHSHL